MVSILPEYHRAKGPWSNIELPDQNAYKVNI